MILRYWGGLHFKTVAPFTPPKHPRKSVGVGGCGGGILPLNLVSGGCSETRVFAALTSFGVVGEVDALVGLSASVTPIAPTKTTAPTTISSSIRCRIRGRQGGDGRDSQRVPTRSFRARRATAQSGRGGREWSG